MLVPLSIGTTTTNAAKRDQRFANGGAAHIVCQRQVAFGRQPVADAVFARRDVVEQLADQPLVEPLALVAALDP